MKLAFGLLIGLFTCTWVFAQTNPDTVKLTEVTVYGISSQHYTSGGKNHKVDSASIKAYGTSSMVEILGATTPIFIRNYGNGMSASVSFRGTGANHTSVLWNGLNLNQPTLGQTDISMIPAFALDQAEVHFGGGSPLFGSDAIGGTISLNDQALRNFSGLKLGLISEVGSYGQRFLGTKAYVGNQKVQSKTVIYGSAIDNDFTFKNNTKLGFPEEKQNNTAVQYWGLIQNVDFNIKPHWSASLKTWYYQSDREIQPTIPLNHNQGMFGHQQDASIRLLANLVYFPNTHQTTELKAAYLYDKLIYSLGGAKEEYFTHQYQILADHERQWLPQFKSRVGAKANLIQVDSDGFTFIPSELRTDFYVSNTYQPNNHFRASFNFRQVLMDGKWAPPSPSLGFSWTFWKGDFNSFQLNAQASRSYRLPTFNERYWPTGNPNILPEQGFTTELGIHYSRKEHSNVLNSEIRVYRMLIDDWVVWQSGNGGFTPVNIKQVEARGLEWNASISGKLSAVNYTLSSSYAFTQSTTQKSRQSDDFIGNQLAYVPLHKANAGLVIFYEGFSGSFNYNFTGHRFYSLSNDQFLPSYQLLDLFLSKKLKIEVLNVEAELGVKVYNVFDAQYQTLQFYAMPGRNFRFSIHLNI